MGAMVFQITSLTIVYSTVYSGSDKKKRQSSASLAFVRGIHRSYDRLISTMGFSLLVRCHLYIESGPRFLKLISDLILHSFGSYLSLPVMKSPHRTEFSTWGRLRNIKELLDFHMRIKSTSLNVWVRYFVWNFKGYLWNSTQNISPIHSKMQFVYNVEILRALRFKSSKTLLVSSC